jgi:hypothetical protein
MAMQQWLVAAWGNSRTGASGQHGPRVGARNGAEGGLQTQASGCPVHPSLFFIYKRWEPWLLLGRPSPSGPPSPVPTGQWEKEKPGTSSQGWGLKAVELNKDEISEQRRNHKREYCKLPSLANGERRQETQCNFNLEWWGALRSVFAYSKHFGNKNAGTHGNCLMMLDITRAAGTREARFIVQNRITNHLYYQFQHNLFLIYCQVPSTRSM